MTLLPAAVDAARPNDLAALIESPPVDGLDAWATSILRHLEQQETGARLRLLPRLSEVLSSRQLEDRTAQHLRLLQLTTDASTPPTEIAEACLLLAGAGAPLDACQGLTRLGRMARAGNERAIGEMIFLVYLAVCDTAGGVTGPPLSHTRPAEDASAAQLDSVLPILSTHDVPHLAAAVQQIRASRAGTTPDLLAGIAAAEVCLLATQVESSDGDWVAWNRGRAARGLAFAVPPGGEARFEGYIAYARDRGLHPAFVAHLTNRWAAALARVGRFGDAHAIRTAQLAELAGVEQGQEVLGRTVVVLQRLSSQWRYGGDLGRAVDYSNQATDLFDRVQDQLTSNSRAAEYLSRAGLLKALGDADGALENALKAQQLYDEDPYAVHGQWEAVQQVIHVHPDPNQAQLIAKTVMDAFDRGEIPVAVRRSCVRTACHALAAFDQTRAVQGLTRLIKGPDDREVTRLDVLVLMELAEILADPTERTATAEQAVHAARGQHDSLLRSRSLLLLSRCQHGADNLAAAEASAREGLGLLSDSLVQLTAQGQEKVAELVRTDLSAVFDLAVATADGDLALRAVEAGRAIRLAALLRLRPEELPESVRAALAEATATSQATHDADPRNRHVATQAIPAVTKALDSALGRLLRCVGTGEWRTDPTHLRRTFPDTHLVAISAFRDTIRWVWWPPHQAPTAGVSSLSSTAARLVDAYASGSASSIPGDGAAGLDEILPSSLVAHLREADEGTKVLICPTGRLWHIPYPAIRIDRDRRLIDAATITLTPSLQFAAELAGRSPRATPRSAAGYCNPQLPGASAENHALSQTWGNDYIPLDGVTQVGTGMATIGAAVLSTHATSDPGLAQAILDHHGNRLSAGQCVTRHFPDSVILGTCHGYGRDLGNDPIGLLTVIASRGAVWVAGGHQDLNDATIGWILAHTYPALHAGTPLPTALRNAQRLYLSHLTSRTFDSDLAQIVADAGGPIIAAHPRFWALTTTGPSVPPGHPIGQP